MPDLARGLAEFERDLQGLGHTAQTVNTYIDGRSGSCGPWSGSICREGKSPGCDWSLREGVALDCSRSRPDCKLRPLVCTCGRSD
jgi:hypothetical protein